MKSPFGDQKIPGSYENLKERMYKKVSANINEQILDIVMKAYESALYEENIVLSLPERKRLFSQIIQSVLEDLMKKLDDGSISVRDNRLSHRVDISFLLRNDVIAWQRSHRSSKKNKSFPTGLKRASRFAMKFPI